MQFTSNVRPDKVLMWEFATYMKAIVFACIIVIIDKINDFTHPHKIISL